MRTTPVYHLLRTPDGSPLILTHDPGERVEVLASGDAECIIAAAVDLDGNEPATVDLAPPPLAWRERGTQGVLTSECGLYQVEPCHNGWVGHFYVDDGEVLPAVTSPLMPNATCAREWCDAYAAAGAAICVTVGEWRK